MPDPKSITGFCESAHPAVQNYVLVAGLKAGDKLHGRERSATELVLV
jgi:hypothetical protein